MFWKCFLYVYGRVTLLDLSGMRLHTTSGRVIIYGFQLLALVCPRSFFKLPVLHYHPF